MATCIISTALIEDLLVEVAPELDGLDEKPLHKLTSLLRPALEAVVYGYKIASLQDVTQAAFKQFLERLADED